MGQAKYYFLFSIYIFLHCVSLVYGIYLALLCVQNVELLQLFRVKSVKLFIVYPINAMQTVWYHITTGSFHLVVCAFCLFGQNFLVKHTHTHTHTYFVRILRYSISVNQWNLITSAAIDMKGKNVIGISSVNNQILKWENYWQFAILIIVHFRGMRWKAGLLYEILNCLRDDCIFIFCM